MENKVEGLEDYEIKYWLRRLGSHPVKRVKHGIGEEDYSIDRIHVLELENGRYATVVEYGCSCYSSEEAEIDLHPDFESANNSFKKWLKDSSDRKEY